MGRIEDDTAPLATTASINHDNTTEAAEVPSAVSSQWKGIAVVWMALFCDYLLMTVAVPIFPELGASTFATGALFSAKAALQIVSSPFVAMFVDSAGLSLLLIGVLVESLSTLVFAFTDSYGWWFGARAVQGVASALILASGFLHVQQLHQGNQKAVGVAMGIVTTGIIGGVTVGPPMGGILYDISTGLPFFVTAGLIGVTFLCAMGYYCTLAPQQPSKQAEEPQGESVAGVACDLLRDKHIASTLVAVFIANAAISCLESTLGNFLERHMGFSSTGTGLIYVVTAVPSVVAAKLAVMPSPLLHSSCFEDVCDVLHGD